MSNTIEIILYLADRAGVPVAFNTDDGKFYLYRDGGEGVARLSPIAEPAQTVATFEPSHIITLGNLSELKRIYNGLETDLQRIGNGFATIEKRLDNGLETDLQRDYNGFATIEKRQAIGSGKVNLQLLTDNCPEDVLAIARKIEDLLERAIRNTNKPATLDMLIKLHGSAVGYISAKNIFKLKQIEQRLRGIVAKQGAIKTSEQTVRRRSFRRQLFAKIFIALVMLAGLVGYFWFTMPKGETATIAGEVPASASPTLSALDAACLEFERETGRKVYPGGRACIKRAAIDAGAIENKNEIKKLLYKYVK